MALIILVTGFQLYRLHQLKNLLKEQEEVMTPVVTYAQAPQVSAPSNIVYMPIHTSQIDATKNDMNWPVWINLENTLILSQIKFEFDPLCNNDTNIIIFLLI